MSSSSGVAPTGVDGLPPEILAVLRPDSTVTHEDYFDFDAKSVWRVVVDGNTVAAFDGEDADDNEDAAVGLRRRIESHVKRLASRAALTTGLRELADFLDEHPEIPDPRAWAVAFPRWGDGAGFRAACDAMRERGFTIGNGTCGEKEIAVSCEFAGGIRLSVEERRDAVGEQRTETREVTEYVLPEWAQPTTPAEGTA